MNVLELKKALDKLIKTGYAEWEVVMDTEKTVTKIEVNKESVFKFINLN